MKESLVTFLTLIVVGFGPLKVRIPMITTGSLKLPIMLTVCHVFPSGYFIVTSPYSITV
jgi:hypothetical protein